MIVNPGIRRFLGSAIQRLFNSASFYAPLTHTAVPQRAATGTTATFTRATTKTVENNDGYLVTLLAGEIGFPGARRVRNFHTATENFTAWSANPNTTVVADQAVAPNGTTTADLLYPATSGNDRGVYRTGTGVDANSAIHIASIYAKSAGKTWIMAYDFAGAAPAAWFNLSAGTVGTVAAGYTAQMTLDEQGFYRCSFRKTAASAVGYVQWQVVNGDNTVAVTANGTDGIYIWGAQLEDVTAQTTQTAGEYVSVGVESAPYYHGSFVDGVACFDYYYLD